MSNKNRIGSKITLDGEADFNKAIKNINNTMRLLRSEAKKNTQEFALNKDQLGYCTSQYSTLSRTMDEQRNKVAIIQKALEDATKQYGENSDAVRKWRTDLNYAQGDLAKTSASLNEMRETLDSADETNFKEAVLKIDDSLSILNSNMNGAGKNAVRVCGKAAGKNRAYQNRLAKSKRKVRRRLGAGEKLDSEA